MVELIFSDEKKEDWNWQHATNLVAAYNDTLGGVAGAAPAGSLNLMDDETLKEWLFDRMASQMEIDLQGENEYPTGENSIGFVFLMLIHLAFGACLIPLVHLTNWQAWFIWQSGRRVCSSITAYLIKNDQRY